jgi:hypothetical protein
VFRPELVQRLGLAQPRRDVLGFALDRLLARLQALPGGAEALADAAQPPDVVGVA